MYRLDRKNYSAGNEIFNEESFADRIFFIVKGKAMLQFCIRDRRAYRIVHETKKTSNNVNWNKVRGMKSALLAMSNSNRSGNQSVTNLGKIGEAKFYLNICSLDRGSVLCSKQAIVEADIRTRLLVTEPCETLSLSLADIEFIATRSKRLKRGIDSVREKYIRWDQEVQSYVVVTPLLDYKKRSQNNEKNAIRTARLGRILRNSILTIVTRKRL